MGWILKTFKDVQRSYIVHCSSVLFEALIHKKIYWLFEGPKAISVQFYLPSQTSLCRALATGHRANQERADSETVFLVIK